MNPRARTRSSTARPALVALAVGLCAALTLRATDASAQDLRAAEEAFRRGGERYLRRDYGAAANFFESSYRSAPSWQALLGAVRSHRQAEGLYHQTRAATLSLELQARYATQRQAMRVAQQTLAELGPRLFRLSVTCEECEVEVDGVLQSTREFFLEPGTHQLNAHWGERLTQQRTLECAAGQTDTITLVRPAPPPPPVVVLPPPPPPPPPPFRFHPAVPIAAGAVGLGLGIGAAVSWWADALPRGARLLTAASNGTASIEQERAVYAAEDRTTGLVIAGSVVGAFAVTAAVLTRWSAPTPPPPQSSSTVSWVVVPTAGGATVAGRF